MGTNASTGASNNATAVGTNAITTGDLATALGASSIGAGIGATALGANAVASANGAIAVGLNSQSTGVNSIAIGTGALATGSIAVGVAASAANGGAAFGDNTVATGSNSVALGLGASATHANSVALGTGATTTRDNQVVIGTATNTYTTPGVTSNASIVAQSGPLSVVTTDGTGNLGHVLVSSLIPVINPVCQELVAGALQCGTNSQATGTQSTALGQTALASGVGSTAIGFGSVASGAGSSVLGAGANASGTGAVAVGAGSSASAPNSVALGSGSIANVANTVSVGAPGGERRITNVAAGINQTDAVNVSQLQTFAAGFQSQIGGLQSQITANNIAARRGIAAAAALSPAIMPTAPGKTTVSINGGFFGGESGVGIGVSHRLNVSIPVMLYGSYANAGGDGHIGRVGGAFEFERKIRKIQSTFCRRVMLFVVACIRPTATGTTPAATSGRVVQATPYAA